MANDYGVRATRTARMTIVVVAATLAVGAGAMIAFDMRDRSQARAADDAAAAGFRIDGTACETLNAESFAAARGTRMGTEFDAEDAHFAMGYGNSDCRAFHTDARETVGADLVCKFGNPSWVAVTTPKSTYYFGSGGSPATIAIKDGEARCVLTGR